MIAATLASVLVFGVQGDKWDIKPDLTKQKMSIVLDANVQGEKHHANFTMTTTFGDKGSDDLLPAKIAWTDIEVDDSPQIELPEWEFKANVRGVLMSANAPLEDAYRRMFVPFAFLHPEKAVASDEKWELKSGPKDATTYTFEAKGMEKVGEKDALKVNETFKENSGPMTGEGTWWIGRDGKPLKFQMKVKNWVAAFAHDEGVEVTITGTAKA